MNFCTKIEHRHSLAIFHHSQGHRKEYLLWGSFLPALLFMWLVAIISGEKRVFTTTMDPLLSWSVACFWGHGAKTRPRSQRAKEKLAFSILKIRRCKMGPGRQGVARFCPRNLLRRLPMEPFLETLWGPLVPISAYLCPLGVAILRY